MSIEQHAEEILLESEEVPTDKPNEESFSKVTAQLIQIQKWKRRGVATQILENKFLFAKTFRNRSSKTYWINLLFVDPAPKRDKHLDWRWGIGALIFLANAAAFITVEHYFHVSAKFIYFHSFTALAATLTLLCILMMVYTAKNTLLFTTLNGHIPILHLEYNKPSKDQFQNYVNALSQCIEQAQQHSRRKNNGLADELAEHRRLKEEKAISEQDYEQAKNNILSRH